LEQLLIASKICIIAYDDSQLKHCRKVPRSSHDGDYGYIGLVYAKLLTAVQKSSILTIERSDWRERGAGLSVESAAKLLTAGREEMASISINLLPPENNTKL